MNGVFLFFMVFDFGNIYSLRAKVRFEIIVKWKIGQSNRVPALPLEKLVFNE